MIPNVSLAVRPSKIWYKPCAIRVPNWVQSKGPGNVQAVMNGKSGPVLPVEQ